MGTLDQPASSAVVRYSKIIDLTGMTRPQTKTALDEFLIKGWLLVSIYRSGTNVRACLVRTKDA